jgi:uncharacterized membrane protein YedE/YeeE
MNNFTPIESLVGGLMIGASAVLLMHGLGRVAGISGIVSGLLQRQTQHEFSWRLAFVAGLLGAAALVTELVPFFSFFDANLPLTVDIKGSMFLIICGGVLVGYGTRLGSGCTSGHGVCGIGRLSRRSIIATFVFMSVAALTVLFMKVVTSV